MIHRRIYISTATRPMTEVDLTHILNVSRRNNATDDITGLLVYHDGHFFQTLEGTKAKIEECYARIALDPLHKDIRLIHDAGAQERAFAGWDMGFARPDDLARDVRDCVFSITDLVPQHSEARGKDAKVRRAVRDFLAAFVFTLPRSKGAMDRATS